MEAQTKKSMNKGKKIILILLALLIAGEAAIGGYWLYEKVLKKQSDTFIQKVLEDFGMSFHNLNTVQVPYRKPDIPRKEPVMLLMDVGSGSWAHDQHFLYPIPLNPDYAIRDVDFAGLLSQYKEVVGYIEFETLPVVSYPVFYQEGTDYYLKHNRYHQSDIYGEIYVEGKIKNGASRTNTIIYGHNMRNGTMFGSLRKYKDAAYLKGNEFFWYYTPKGKYRYQIFSVYETLYTSDTFTWFEDVGPEYTAWLEKMNNQTKYDTGARANPNDQVITLCTCTSAGGNYRLILQARLVYRDEALK